MGRTPEPASLRLLKGRSPGRDSGGRKVVAPPQAVPACPERPDWLTPDAQDMWQRVTPELERLGLLGRIDLGALAAYCEAWATWREARRLLDAEGVVVAGRDGNAVRHPAVMVANAASAELRAWAVQLGLTPAARQRMTAPPVDDDLETERLFGRVPATPRR